MGFVPQEILQELYHIADIGVIPSYFEEFGYVAVEMMMNQCPFIIRNTTGLKEITDNGKYAVLFKTVNELVDIIVLYLSQEKNKKVITIEIKEILKQYSIKLFEKHILKIYNYLENPNNNNLQ